MEDGLYPSTPNPLRAGRPFVKITLPVRAAAEAVDTFLFKSEDQDYEIVGAFVNYVTAGGASAALQLRNVADTVAIGSGTAMLESAFDLTATALTQQTGVLASTTQSNRILPKGNWLAADFSGTVTGLVGLGLTVWLKPINPNPKA